MSPSGDRSFVLSQGCQDSCPSSQLGFPSADHSFSVRGAGDSGPMTDHSFSVRGAGDSGPSSQLGFPSPGELDQMS